jgi:Xaa-Pro aminopeptidase
VSAGDAVGVERALPVAEAGVAAVASRLAEATAVDGPLVDAGRDRLSTADLVAAADAAMERRGGDPAGATTVDVRDGLRADEPVVVAVAPRVDGRPGPLARTLVVDGTGGWDRRAAVAVGMAHDAVRRIVEPELPARRVVDEAVAELGAYGLAAADSGPPVARPVGASAPDFGTDAPLAAGQVFALDPAVTPVDPDEERGPVRVGSCYAVTDAGCRPLGSAPTSLSPAAY